MPNPAHYVAHPGAFSIHELSLICVRYLFQELQSSADEHGFDSPRQLFLPVALSPGSYKLFLVAAVHCQGGRIRPVASIESSDTRHPSNQSQPGTPEFADLVFVFEPLESHLSHSMH